MFICLRKCPIKGQVEQLAKMYVSLKQVKDVLTQRYTDLFNNYMSLLGENLNLKEELANAQEVKVRIILVEQEKPSKKEGGKSK